jgi:hypothetical protein
MKCPHGRLGFCLSRFRGKKATGISFSFYVYISHSNKRLCVTIGDNIWENCLNDLKKNEGLQRRRA